jgi:hypothetical protein
MEVNKHKDFDQIFREKLQQHEVAPPAHIWEGVQAGAAHSSNSWRWWAAAGLMAVILSGASFLYFSSNDLSTEKSLSKQNTELPVAPVTHTESPEKVSSETTIITEEVEQEIIQSVVESFHVEERAEQAIAVDPVEQAIIAEDVVEEPAVELTSSPQDSDVIWVERSDMEKVAPQTGGMEDNTASEPLDEVAIGEASKAAYDFFDDDAIDEITKGHNQEKRWELGIEFSPEWITIPENDNNIRSYGLDLSARYHFSKWFVETGLGASLSKDDGLYKVDTISQFKGSYMDVYEVTFDESSGEPIPIYHTELKNVYENIDTNYVSRTENDYVYLNIPLNIGYSTKLSDKFAVYFKTGLVNSFKIYENIPAFETVNNTDNDIIHSEARYFNRTNWNMQAQLNIGMHYFITDKFIFGVEPNARYYIKSLVEDNNGGNPYGFGVKFGFKYVIKK